ncbi:VOC family protein [Homoserinimonas sp. A447]
MSTRDTAPLGAPCWIDLPSSDTEQARTFYGGLFGWTFEVSDGGDGDYINCLRGGSRVAGIMQKGPESETAESWITYFASADAQVTADLADDSGGQSTVAPMEVGSMGTVAMLEDPGGAAVGVWQPGQHTGFTRLDEPGTPVWHELITPNYRASVLFYETVFGWMTKVESDTDDFQYTTADFDGTSLAGIMDGTVDLAEDAPARWDVYFGTENVDSTVALAESLGARVVDAAEDSPYGRFATLADPSGAEFKVMTPSEWQSPSPGAS